MGKLGPMAELREKANVAILHEAVGEALALAKIEDEAKPRTEIVASPLPTEGSPEQVKKVIDSFRIAALSEDVPALESLTEGLKKAIDAVAADPDIEPLKKLRAISNAAGQIAKFHGAIVAAKSKQLEKAPVQIAMVQNNGVTRRGLVTNRPSPTAEPSKALCTLTVPATPPSGASG